MIEITFVRKARIIIHPSKKKLSQAHDNAWFFVLPNFIRNRNGISSPAEVSPKMWRKILEYIRLVEQSPSFIRVPIGFFFLDQVFWAVCQKRSGRTRLVGKYPKNIQGLPASAVESRAGVHFPSLNQDSFETRLLAKIFPGKYWMNTSHTCLAEHGGFQSSNISSTPPRNIIRLQWT
jgi:hypothetical protein